MLNGGGEVQGEEPRREVEETVKSGDFPIIHIHNDETVARTPTCSEEGVVEKIISFGATSLAE